MGVFPWILDIALLASLSACAPAGRDATLAGQTMGTTYSIRIADASLNRRKLQALRTEVDAVLDEINRQMSTWRPDSEISRFNSVGAYEPIAISPDFQVVVRRALEIAKATGGAFDPTVGALVNLWGFGPDGQRRESPTADQIAAAREKTGWPHLVLSADGRLSKDISDLKLDLGAIAKGFGVDKATDLLRAKGVQNFLVEIGGETRADGVNAQGEPWRVGVLRPDYCAPPRPCAVGGEVGSPTAQGGGARPTQNPNTFLQGVVRLTGGNAIATSGDYRNFFRDEAGQIQAHIIDPRTAAPVPHNLASVSVLAGDCLTADALATALFVLGPEEGLRLLAAAFPGMEALFIVHSGDGEFEEVATPGFAAAAQYTQ